MSNSKNESSKPQVIYRKDYQPHDFRIPEISLEIDLKSAGCVVKAISKVERHPEGFQILFSWERIKRLSLFQSMEVCLRQNDLNKQMNC